MADSQEAKEATPEAAVQPETPPDDVSPQRPAQGRARGGVVRDAPEPGAPQDDVPLIPTGFPVPVQQAQVPDREQAKPGHVTLATRPPMDRLTVPPLEGGGETVTITAEGTEVDDATAARAHEAARLAGISLREI